ncbi:MAG: glycoside hydrolase family 25 protein [Chloroflexota bacterium]
MAEYPHGIVVSNNQGSIDWARVAASGQAFAFIKATEGTGFRDGYFPKNWQGARANGIIRGAYCFGRPDLVQPETEAQAFWAAAEAQGVEAGDMLALDLEDYSGSLVRSLNPVAEYAYRWLLRVEQLAGYKPLIYTSAGVCQQYNLGSLAVLADYGLWLASWGVETPPPAPRPWHIVAFHQYGVAPAGSVPGISGDIDVNRFNGTADRIALYGKPGAQPQAVTGFSVGEGLRAAMAERGDQPASDEVFMKHEGRDSWSEAFGVSGARYVWVPTLGRAVRFDPAA